LKELTDKLNQGSKLEDEDKTALTKAFETFKKTF
jgi:hypothetical protein